MISFLLTLKRLISGLIRAFKQRYFVALFVLIVIMLLSGTLFYTGQEGLSVLDALYFCVATLSTVGIRNLCRKHRLARYSPWYTSLSVRAYSLEWLGNWRTQ